MPPSARVRSALIALALIATGSAGLGAASPSATPPPPGLSISIDDAAKSTAPDSDVSYRVTLANAGTAPITAWVVASIPAYGKVTDAGGGEVAGQDVTWKLTVDAAKTQSETLKAHIGTIPKDSYRVTALASVYLGQDTSGAPLIRSADSDAIPGVRAPVLTGRTPSAAPAPRGDGSALPLGIAGGVVILAAAAGALLLGLRRRARGARRRAE